MRATPAAIAACALAVLIAMLAALAFTPLGDTARQHLATALGRGTDTATQWEPSLHDPTYLAEDPAARTRTEEQLRQIAYDVCPQALDAGDCRDYTVEITDLDGALGLVEVSWERPASGTPENEVPLKTSGVKLDRSLLGKPTQYVANVAAHEWNHIEQALVLGNLEARNALETRAYDYYDARVPSGLPRREVATEILTDCMATLGDNVPADAENTTAPHYLRSYTGTADPVEACGQWEAVLTGEGA